MACHVRVASENARLGTPEVKLGLMCGYAGTQRLPRLVGKGRALEMLLTGEMIDAQEALRVGLVNHVFPQESLLAEAEPLLRKMLANGPLSLRLTLDAVNAGLEMPFAAGGGARGHALRPPVHHRRHEGGDEGVSREAPAPVQGPVKQPPAALPDATGLRIVVLRARFNDRVVDGLLAGAREALAEAGARPEDVDGGGRARGLRAAARGTGGGRGRSASTPSSPSGAVIRGETDHYEHIAREAASGLAAVGREAGVPVAFGVLTVGEESQALSRSAPGPENKGAEAARAAVAMVHVLRASEDGAPRWDGRTKARECAFQMLYQWATPASPWPRRRGGVLERADHDRPRHRADGGAPRARRAPESGGPRRRDRRGGHELAARTDRGRGPEHHADRDLRAHGGAGDALGRHHRRGGGDGAALREADSPSFVNGVLDSVMRTVRQAGEAKSV